MPHACALSKRIWRVLVWWRGSVHLEVEGFDEGRLLEDHRVADGAHLDAVGLERRGTREGSKGGIRVGVGVEGVHSLSTKGRRGMGASLHGNNHDEALWQLWPEAKGAFGRGSNPSSPQMELT
eukprot:5977495-Pleurochrysis_carterae.AAC.1